MNAYTFDSPHAFSALSKKKPHVCSCCLRDIRHALHQADLGELGDTPEQRQAAAEAQARHLSAEMLGSAGNIDRKAGEMESSSPLFRDSAANRQPSLF